MLEIRLRPAQRSDAATIRAMVRAAHINPFSLDWRRFSMALSPQGKVVGCVQVKPHGDGTQEMASLVVAPEARGQGIARVLIESAQSAHPPPLYLTCRSSLQDFYRKFGFSTLKPNELPPYFHRLYRLFLFIRFFVKIEDGLTVMRWIGPQKV